MKKRNGFRTEHKHFILDKGNHHGSIIGRRGIGMSG
ncbi:hypothetical protein HNR48_002118 [Pseudoteredinibacter isoporae]|uniref:Uncharacterized protein n=1 Tax=Pseudoteredinibacter isoporae TaxID=570281 RepID=A0A7X0JT68_9GAMM|nr:hypothetical protein [Pseudoteredinibacter isoporae]